MTLGPTTDDSSSITTTALQFMPPGPGRLLSITLTADVVTPGECTFTLEEVDTTILGTVIMTIIGGEEYNLVDFRTGLTSGTNEFDGTKKLVFGMDPTNPTNSIQALITFELDLP